MSYELDYFPPDGTYYNWHHKALNYSPWHCDFSRQREPKLDLWPLSIDLYVDYKDGKWTWFVEVIDFQHERSCTQGESETPIHACMEAEEVAQVRIDELLPNWVRTALKNKWRPPAIKTKIL